METDFIYWSHPTPVGIKVEEVFGMENRSGNLWKEMAKQIYCEHGPESYREIGYFQNGAPFIMGLEARISMTHTNHFLAVTMLPRTPETDLRVFNPRTALGIDAEKLDRGQVIKIRSKFLSDEELKMIPEDDLLKNIIAWTCKEALYKAAMTEGLDFKNKIILKKLPEIDKNVAVPHDASDLFGKAVIILSENKNEDKEKDAADKKTFETEYEMTLYCYESEGNCVTLAFSPKCVRFGGH